MPGGSVQGGEISHRGEDASVHGGVVGEAEFGEDALGVDLDGPAGDVEAVTDGASIGLAITAIRAPATRRSPAEGKRLVTAMHAKPETVWGAPPLGRLKRQRRQPEGVRVEAVLDAAARLAHAAGNRWAMRGHRGCVRSTIADAHSPKHVDGEHRWRPSSSTHEFESRPPPMTPMTPVHNDVGEVFDEPRNEVSSSTDVGR
jgi:hypothetical protein